MIKKKAYGWPDHGFLASIVCMNKLYLNRAERMRKWDKKRFKGFRNNTPPALPEKKPPRAQPKFQEDNSFRNFKHILPLFVSFGEYIYYELELEIPAVKL